jgi:lipopolysaccharide/colanic/teichoic acid biosynthesis glycosyltransferase
MDYELIYEMRPGLTSEATLYNGYTDTVEKMLKRMELDIRYLEHRSLGMDLSIIINTIVCIVSGRKFLRKRTNYEKIYHFLFSS